MPTVSPKIDSMSPRAPKVEVVKGAVIRLMCTASGKPTPIITWSRKVRLRRLFNFLYLIDNYYGWKTSYVLNFIINIISHQNNVMPNGESNITSSVLEMMHADRQTVGHYRCTATNGVEQPDTREIFVNVLCEYYFTFHNNTYN